MQGQSCHRSLPITGHRRRRGTLLFMGATNEPWAIDPAALRPGRFDAKVYVGLPELAARRRMLDLYLARRPLVADLHLEQLATELDGYSGADIAEVCGRSAARAFMESIRNGTDRDITAEDIRSVLSSMRPSVLAKELEKYKRWATDAGN